MRLNRLQQLPPTRRQPPLATCAPPEAAGGARPPAHIGQWPGNRQRPEGLEARSGVAAARRGQTMMGGVAAAGIGAGIRADAGLVLVGPRSERQAHASLGLRAQLDRPRIQHAAADAPEVRRVGKSGPAADLGGGAAAVASNAPTWSASSAAGKAGCRRAHAAESQQFVVAAFPSAQPQESLRQGAALEEGVELLPHCDGGMPNCWPNQRENTLVSAKPSSSAICETLCARPSR
jgi:hypothetical protein